MLYSMLAIQPICYIGGVVVVAGVGVCICDIELFFEPFLLFIHVNDFTGVWSIAKFRKQQKTTVAHCTFYHRHSPSV